MRLAFSPRRLAVLALGIFLAVALTVAALWLRPTPSTPVAQPERPQTVEGPREAPRVLVFGDSWTYGMAATEREEGYAYLLSGIGGWNVTVDGEPGSGYLRKGFWGRTFGERIAQLDAGADPGLIVLQGSINDRTQPESGYRAAVDAAWDDLAERFPDAQVLVLGPAPQVLPVEDATARIDRDLSDLADERGWPYVSPVQERWITQADYDDLIDTSKKGKNHPSDEGHRYLAEKVAAAIRPLLDPAPVEAVTEQPEPARGD